MASFWKDLRYGARTLLKTPGFTALAVLALALGIGANTAIFTVVDAALLRPMGYREPGRLVHLWETRPRQDFEKMEASYPNYQDWRARSRSFEQLAGYNRTIFSTRGREFPEMLTGGRVTASFLPTLGLRPMLGRNFEEAEEKRESRPVAMLTYKSWQARFAGDPEVIGKTITLDNDPFEVVGVLPAHFQFAPLGTMDVLVPLRPGKDASTRRNFHWLKAIGKLRAGVTQEQALAEMKTIVERLEAEHPDANAGAGVRLVPLREQIVGEVRPAMLVLLGAVAFALLIACANVANLLLVRAAARQKEVAIRAALGAGRWRLARQLLTESVLLGLAGGALGVVWAQWGVDLLIAAIPQSILNSMPYLQELHLDGRVLLFTALISLATGILFGLVPAWQASRSDLHVTLKEGGTRASAVRHRVRSMLVISEIAIALVLLVGAGLMLKSLQHLLKVDPGFEPRNLLTAALEPDYKKYDSDPKMLAFHDEILRRVGSLPGVQSVATTTSLPLMEGNTIRFVVEGRPVRSASEDIEANIRSVSAGYFQVMGIPLLRGRWFNAEDRLDSPRVVIVNRALAQRVFPGEDPVGKRITFTAVPNDKPYQIVGVTGDVNDTSLDTPARPAVFTAYSQDVWGGTNLVVRTASDPRAMHAAIQHEIAELDAGLPLWNVRTMEEIIADDPGTFLRRYPTMLITAFAGLALVLAMVGIYGVISYSVTQQTHEIGVRMALGARSADVLRLVLGQGLRMLLAGLAIGTVTALAMSRALAHMLFQVSATDPLTFAWIAALLSLIALLASYIPARRATRVDPMIALRYE